MTEENNSKPKKPEVYVYEEIIKYTTGEKLWIAFISIFLLAAVVFGFWFFLDVWSGDFSILSSIGYDPEKFGETLSKELFQLLAIAMTGGWLGGCITSINSLREHVGAITDNKYQSMEEKWENKFFTSWLPRWIFGPPVGSIAAVFTYALLKSGFLAFFSTPQVGVEPGDNEFFVAIGLGGLVGLASKDVILKLIDVLKSNLKGRAEAEVLQIKGSKLDQIKFGEVRKLSVDPKINVTWKIIGVDDVDAYGTLEEGPSSETVYVAPKEAPTDVEVLTFGIKAAAVSDTTINAVAAITVKK